MYENVHRYADFNHFILFRLILGTEQTLVYNGVLGENVHGKNVNGKKRFSVNRWQCN